MTDLMDSETRTAAGRIVSIDVDLISPHPKNPRKDLGDVTELADSIRERGLLQPIVVIPRIASNGSQDTNALYTVICGHRRLAAAKSAGLSEIDCILTEMSERDQMAAMLLENIQRSNLTPLEEADGYQMMLDLGEDFGGIAKSTGVSESTIRRRVRLLELDRAKAESAFNRGATLEQYGEVLQIKDVEQRECALNALGTNGFEFELRRAKANEESKERREEFLNRLKEKYTFLESDAAGDLICVQTVSSLSDKALPDFGEDIVMYCKKSEYGESYEIYRERTSEDEDKEAIRRIRKTAMESIRREHEQLNKLAYENRQEFIISLNEKDLAKKRSLLPRELINVLINMPVYGMNPSFARLAKLLGLEEEYRKAKEDVENGESEEEDLKQFFFEIASRKSNKALTAVVYMFHNDNENIGYADFKGTYIKNGGLDRLYDFLGELGYQKSDAEKELADGTHELFAKAGEANSSLRKTALSTN